MKRSRLQLEALDNRDVPALLIQNGGLLFIESNPYLGSTVVINPVAPGVIQASWHDGTGLGQHRNYSGVSQIEFVADGPGNGIDMQPPNGNHVNSFTNNTPISDSFDGTRTIDNVYVGGYGNEVVHAGYKFNSITTRSLTSATVYLTIIPGYGLINSLGVHTNIFGNESGYVINNP